MVPGADRQSGFGVANVNQRIHVYYGEQYGISYESHPGEGTLVRIQVADHVSEVPMDTVTNTRVRESGDTVTEYHVSEDPVIQ